MKQKYYSLSAIDKARPWDFALIFGQKGNGKSYAVKKRLIEDYIAGRGEFVYLRRFHDEAKTHLVAAQFADMPVSELTGGEYEYIEAYQNGLYFSRSDAPRAEKIGYYMTLDREQKYAGVQLPKVTNIFFDEFFSRDYYIHNEPYRLMCFISTIARDRHPSVYCAGNTINKFCPYIAEWNMDKILTMPKGSVVDILVEGVEKDEPRRVVVERCAETGRKTSGLIMGSAAANVEKGEWIAKNAPHLPEPIENYCINYTFVIKLELMKFLCRLISGNGVCGIYVEPKTSEVKSGTRLITDDVMTTGNLISYNIAPIAPGEEPIFDLLRKGRIYYSDNTTAYHFALALEKYGFRKDW